MEQILKIRYEVFIIQKVAKLLTAAEKTLNKRKTEKYSKDHVTKKLSKLFKLKKKRK